MPITGNYSETIKGNFDETKRFFMGFVRKGIPWIDADENKKEWIRFTQMRRAFDVLIGNASPNNGFKPVGTSANNDFTLKGGDGTLNGAGRMYVSGLGCFLTSDINYKNAGATPDQLCIFSTISFITTTTITNDTIQDSSANFIPGELVGATITPDVKQPGVTATVVSNTANSIVTNANLVTAGINISTFPRYRIELAPPGGGTRTDDIYINAYIREISDTEDPSIRHNLGTSMAGDFYGGLRSAIYIRAGGGAVTTNYIDVDGLEHFLAKIGTITRHAGVNAIAPGDVVDLRETSASLTSFLPKAGGTMTGDIQLSGANIVMLGSERVDGRRVSIDGAKLDTITWSGLGVAGLLPLISWPMQGTNLSGVTTQQVNVSTYLKNRVPGGTPSQKGVITAPPMNRVVVQNASTEDDIIDGQGAKVYGRLTETTLVLTGNIDFTFNTTTIVGHGTLFTTQLQQGDIIQGPDGAWYTIASTPGSDTTATIVETFVGTTTLGVTGVNRQRWILSLFSLDSGTENTFTPPGATNVAWFWHEVFDESTRPVINPLFAVPSDQVAAEIPDATTSQKGKVLLAPNLGATPGQVVQANDSRLGRVIVQNAGPQTGTAVTPGASTGLEGILNFITTAGLSIAIYEDTGTGKTTLVFANTSPGGGGPPAFGGTPQPDIPGGSAGSGATYAGGTHQHDLTGHYSLRNAAATRSGTPPPTFDLTTGFWPYVIFGFGSGAAGGGGGFSAGIALGPQQGGGDTPPAGSSPTFQHSVFLQNGGSNGDSGDIVNLSGSGFSYNVSHAANDKVTFTSGGGSAVGVFVGVAIGSDL